MIKLGKMAVVLAPPISPLAPRLDVIQGQLESAQADGAKTPRDFQEGLSNVIPCSLSPTRSLAANCSQCFSRWCWGGANANGPLGPEPRRSWTVWSS